MKIGLPIDLLRLITCPDDGGMLRAPARLDVMVDGSVSCAVCHRIYPVRGGIVSLLDAHDLHPESALEMQKRDEKTAAQHSSGRDDWSSPYTQAGEIGPTLEAVSALPGAIVAELGCGTGRYSLRLLASAGALVAADFSLGSLRLLRQRLPAGARVVLLQADVTRPVLAREAFDRLLSTLHSNLPTRSHRLESLAVAAAAIRDGGRCVISMHHYGLRDFLTGQPAVGRYEDSGIFRHHLRQREARREASAYFGRLTFEHIHASIPALPSIAVSRLARRLPLVRSSLGRLFLAVGERPIRRSFTPH